MSMWFNGWEPILRTVVGGTATYAALVLILRLSGPRTLAKWYAFDLVVTVALGSTFANGVLSPDISIAQAVASFLLLVLLQFAITRTVVAFPSFIKVVNPAPVLLVSHGELLRDVMHDNQVTTADVRKAVRASGRGAIEDVAAVILEPDGQFSVVAAVDEAAMSALTDVAQHERLRRKPMAARRRASRWRRARRRQQVPGLAD